MNTTDLTTYSDVQLSQTIVDASEILSGDMDGWTEAERAHLVAIASDCLVIESHREASI